MKILSVKPEGDYVHYCPGCDTIHRISTKSADGPNWEFDGNLEAPTFDPSIRITWPGGPKNKRCCHYNIIEGSIRFAKDSTHQFAGQSVPLQEFPEEKIKYYL